MEDVNGVNLVSIQHVLECNSSYVSAALLFCLFHDLIESLDLLIWFEESDQDFPAFVLCCHIRYYLINYIRFYIFLSIFKTGRFLRRRFLNHFLWFLDAWLTFVRAYFWLCFNRYIFLLMSALIWKSRKRQGGGLRINKRGLIELVLGIEVEVRVVHSKIL